jgi:hypothetical protein
MKQSERCPKCESTRIWNNTHKPQRYRGGVLVTSISRMSVLIVVTLSIMSIAKGYRQSSTTEDHDGFYLLQKWKSLLLRFRLIQRQLVAPIFFIRGVASLFD